MPNPTPTPAERFAAILLWLGRAVDTRSMWGRLARSLGQLIQSRIREIKHRFARLAARIAAGTYVPRRCATLRPHTERRPRQPNPLPHDFAWLIKLVPETAASACQLRSLLADPEMAALLAAAPTSMARPIRSLCRMLGVEPPPILPPPPSARPKKAAAPKAERPCARKPSPGLGRPRYVFGLRYPPPFPDPA